MVITDGEGKEYVLRLYREGREPGPGVMERLVGLSGRRSPYVVNTYEAGEDPSSGRFYEIQEYLPEGDLDAWAGGRALSGEEFRELVGQLSRAVAMIHREGLVHRDIKPDNILLRSRAPLRVALADFGISSAADPTGAARETRTSATPLYSPPESFAGFAGPAGDWWSLGVVLLECAEGRHPLAGLPLNMVMREIGSRGLRVPEGLDPQAERLLKGLLTRDDRRRWGEREVAAWLSGKRDVPVAYEADLALSAQGGEGGFDTPFVFMGEAHRTPQSLAAAFAASPEAWEAAARALSRGQVRDWLEENRAYDEAVSMEDPEAAGPDEALFSFVLLFGLGPGHVWRGERLSPELFAEILTSPANTAARDLIASELYRGELARLPAAAERRGRPMPPLLSDLLRTRPAEPAGLGLAREATVEWPPRGTVAPAVPAAPTVPDAPNAPAVPDGPPFPPGAGGHGGLLDDGVPGAPGLSGPGGGGADSGVRTLYAAALAAAGSPGDYVWGLSPEPPPPAECIARVLSSGMMPVSWSWYEANISSRFPVPEEIFRGLGGAGPGFGRAAAGLARAADMMREGAGGPCIFYRFRKVRVRGREVRVSPLTMEEWSRYFQFRLIADRPGRMRAAGFHMERVIRDREEQEGARRLNPFRGRWAWAGNWGPLALAVLWGLWAWLASEGHRYLAATLEESMRRQPFFSGNALFMAGLPLGFIVVLLFWAVALLAAETMFTRMRNQIVTAAMAVLFVLWIGFTAQNLKMALLVANLTTIAAWRQLLGVVLKRRLLVRGADPDE
ncbi:MAG: protein kinase [Deltaproteobacteria bacterium]|jgi:hypothetical protein|nr:protein kinase [Deltaproteobacteria bacterium]